MQLQELIKKSEESQYPLSHEGEPEKCYILKYENGLWLVENLKTKQRKTLAFGDKLEFYNNTECHKTTGEWIGTCMGEISSWNSSYINVKYREGMYNYMMANDTKFYSYYPVQLDIEKIVNKSRKISYILLGVILLYLTTVFFLIG